MSEVRAMFARVLGVIRKGRSHDLDEELKEHAALLAADYVRKGMSEKEAHYAAMRELGNMAAVRQEYREQNGLPLIENFWLDLKYAVRTLRRNSTFTAVCIATLALGLGAMISVLCVLSTVFWKPLPYPNPQRLVGLKQVDPRKSLWTFSQPTLLDVEQRAQSLAAVAGYERRTLALTGLGKPEMLQAAAVTPSFFEIFGIKPGVGRVLQSALPYVVISRRLFDRKWQNGSQVVGRALRLDGEAFTIAGIADPPRDLLPGVDLLFPLDLKATESRSAHEIDVVARLRPGVRQGQAQAELRKIASEIARENARTDTGWSMQAKPLADEIVGPKTARMVWMIFAAVALLWVLACTNVAGLQIARSVARRHENATRVALGAGKGRLVGQALTETLVLAIAGALLGAEIADGVVALLREFAGGFLPRVEQLHLDGRTTAIAIGCMLASTLLSGLLSTRTPALQGGRKIARRDPARDSLIVVQVALASVLLLGASLLSQSFLRLRAVDPGFDPENVLDVRVNLPARIDSNLQRTAFFQNVAEQLARLPEMDHVGATSVTPFSGEGLANRFRIDDEPESSEYHSAAWRAVTPGFFTTLGIPLKSGRLLTEADINGAPEVVILSESMAKRFWPNQNPIGKRLLWGSSRRPKTIVGIVGDLRDLAVDQSPVATMYRPFAQLSDAPMTLVVRTKGDPSAAIADIRRSIWAVDQDVALEFQPLREAMSKSIRGQGASLAAMAAFALGAMLTAAFGLYGLISYRVNQRQQEIGIRLALGAPVASIVWSVQRRCLALVCAGVGIGLPSGYLLAALMRSLLYETGPAQGSAYAAVAVLFAAIAYTASWGPARRAARLDPVAAMRHE